MTCIGDTMMYIMQCLEHAREKMILSYMMSCKESTVIFERKVVENY